MLLRFGRIPSLVVAVVREMTPSGFATYDQNSAFRVVMFTEYYSAFYWGGGVYYIFSVKSGISLTEAVSRYQELTIRGCLDSWTWCWSSSYGVEKKMEAEIGSTMT